jgi:hypothetical protein
MLKAVGAESASAAPDWIFLLGNASLPSSLRERVKHGAHLVSDAADATPAISVFRHFEAAGRSLVLHQRAAPLAGSSILLDSLGEPLGTAVSLERGTLWHFALRFHPDWSDWPLTGAFPAWWGSQLHPESTRDDLVAPEQATPRREGSASPSAPLLPGFERIDWRLLCWLVAALLFLLERWLSGRSIRQQGSA